MPGGISMEQVLAAQDLAPEGPIAEFGVAEGAATFVLASCGETVYAFDTFEGMPEEGYDAALDSPNPPGKFKPSERIVRRMENTRNIMLVQGRFEDTLPIVPDHIRFGFCFVDCDWYSSHKTVLDWLPGRLLPRAVVVFDDYRTCAGAKKAIDEWCKEHNLALVNEHYVIWRAHD